MIQRERIQFEQSQMLKRLPEQFFAKLTRKARAVEKQGLDVINLGQGNPDLATPEHIVSTLQKAAAKPLNHRYAPFQGYDYLKEAAATFYDKEYGVDIDPHSEVAILFGGKVGLVEISQCLLNTGDVALVPDPGYPDYWSGIAMANGRMSLMPLRKENHFLPDYNNIPNRDLKRAKLMFLNYPNNPTASVATQPFFEETVNLARQHKLCVVHDFAYGAIGYDGHRPISFLQAEGAKDVGIEIYTLSKTYNMAGWRIAFAVGNAGIIEMLELIQDHYYVSLFGAIQEAAAAALLGDQHCVRSLVNTYEHRRNVFMTGLRDIGWQAEKPAGSFYAWLPVPETFTSESFADFLLEQAHIVVAPGIGFGDYGEGYVRVGLLSPEKRLQQTVQRLDDLNLF
jgi:L-glutamine---4-(methylsulfanyl)-2-oxobutanoate aminotransferase